jgi:endoglucanase
VIVILGGFLFTSPQKGRPLRWRLIALALTTVMVLAAFVVSSSSAQADTSGFRGMNWARLGDNYTQGELVVQGLKRSDSNSTVRAKANALYDDMQSSMGVNTVRLPINTATVDTTWWDSYRGAIDAATDRGFKVILAYWEDGAASQGRITNTNAFNSMWNTVVSQYGSNGLVYFEPMNEPHGYSSGDWRDFAAEWIDSHSSVPRGRILIGGTGFSQDLRPVCDDSRFDGTLLAIHYYAFWHSFSDYSSWRNQFEASLGGCASRAVVTEFGAPMDDGLDYGSATSDNNFVTYIRGITDSMHDLHIGGIYWPAAGGKNNRSGYDWYSMFALTESDDNLNLTIRNMSGADRVRFGWGDESGGGTGPT